MTPPAGAPEVVWAEAARGVGILKIWVDAGDERRGARVKLDPDIYVAALDEAQVRTSGDRACHHPGGSEAAAPGWCPAIHPHALRRAGDDEYLGLVASRPRGT